MRVGYLLASPTLVAIFEGQVTGYRLGLLQEEMALAALADTEHLPALRQQVAAGRAQFVRVLAQDPGVQVFDSKANFVLARFTDGRPGAALAAAMLTHGIRIKSFSPFEHVSFDAYFRLTVGTRGKPHRGPGLGIGVDDEGSATGNDNARGESRIVTGGL